MTNIKEKSRLRMGIRAKVILLVSIIAVIVIGISVAMRFLPMLGLLILLIPLGFIYGKKLELRNKEHKKLNQVKSDLISTVSHELRTPLAIIKESVLLVLDGVPGEINQKQKDILEMGRDNIDRLMRIIDDLLDISNIESGKMELKKNWVDVAEIIRELCQKWKLESSKKE